MQLNILHVAKQRLSFWRVAGQAKKDVATFQLFLMPVHGFFTTGIAITAGKAIVH